MRNALLFILAALFTLSVSCRREDALSTQPLQLRFSTDTLMLDTVFEGIGSSTYQLKVYNDQKEKVKISEIRLANPASPFRLNINGQAAQRLKNVEILAEDSIYIFVEVTAAVGSQNQLVVEDQILFSGQGAEQSVELVTLAQRAIFHYPTNFIVIGNGPSASVIPYSIIDCNTTWTADVPHVIYGYAVVDSGCALTVDPGANVHFHQNSGLWVFDYGQLSVAPGAFPGRGDSVTFSSDRLEPGFEDAPGQWGGVLGGIYIGQRARAQINNAVIKNATTGIRTDSAVFSDQLQLSNSYLFNHSRTALLAGYSNIEADNVVLANSGLYTFYGFGGNYRFRHCTFANYWSGNTRQEPAVLLTNFLDFVNAQGQVQRIVRDVEEAYFGNCIIYGNNPQELNLAEDPSGRFDFEFNHALLRLNTDLSARGFDVNDPEFEQVIVNFSPGFLDPNENKYGLDSLSQAVDQGNVTDGAVLGSDILGRNRNVNGLPDLGAFERPY